MTKTTTPNKFHGFIDVSVTCKKSDGAQKKLLVAISSDTPHLPHEVFDRSVPDQNKHPALIKLLNDGGYTDVTIHSIDYISYEDARNTRAQNSIVIDRLLTANECLRDSLTEALRRKLPCNVNKKRKIINAVLSVAGMAVATSSLAVALTLGPCAAYHILLCAWVLILSANNIVLETMEKYTND